MTNKTTDRFTSLAGAAGALHGLLGVAALAASAHGSGVASGAGELLQRGGQLELYHALAIFAALSVSARLPAFLFALGGALFALPLYLHALAGSAALVFMAPLGGLTLLGGWAILLWGLLRPGLRTA